MQENVFDNKEHVREIYEFGNDDPYFENFYRGVVLLNEKKPREALHELWVAADCDNFTNVYRYILAASIDAGLGADDIIPMFIVWIVRARTTGNKHDNEVVNSARDFVVDHFGSLDKRIRSIKSL